MIYIHTKYNHYILKKINTHKNKYLLNIYNKNSVLITNFSTTTLNQTPISSLNHNSITIPSKNIIQIIPPPTVNINKSPHDDIPLNNLKNLYQLFKFRKLYNYNLSHNLI